MTNRADILEALAERVEKASGPDRELDALIAVASDPTDNARVIYGKACRFYKAGGPGRIPFAVKFGTGVQFGMILQNVRYTASLDAAMTLAPEGWYARVTNAGNCDIANSAWLHETNGGKSLYVDAATPALALAAAALRAHAMIERERSNG